MSNASNIYVVIHKFDRQSSTQNAFSFLLICSSNLNQNLSERPCIVQSQNLCGRYLEALTDDGCMLDFLVIIKTIKKVDYLANKTKGKMHRHYYQIENYMQLSII